MSYKILIINPGSTSTKIGVYEDETQLMEETLRHSTEEIAQYATIYDQKLFEVQKYITYVNYQYHPEVLTMNAKYYNSLPAEYQQILSDAAWLFIETENKIAIENAESRLEEMKAYGCDVYTPTDAEKQAFVDACTPVYDHFVNTLKYFTQEELDLVKSLAMGK